MPTPPRRAWRLTPAARAVPLVLLALLGVPRAEAADVVVLTAGAFKPVLLDLAPGFLARTGQHARHYQRHRRRDRRAGHAR